MSTESGQVNRVPAAAPEEALQHFEAMRRFETDPSEVYEDQKAGFGGFVVLDVRAEGAYRKSHIPGAFNIPFDKINEESVAELPEGTIVVYCWGPGCNGTTQAAVTLSRLGRSVKEMIGGWEYWLREEYPVEGRGRVQRSYVGASD